MKRHTSLLRPAVTSSATARAIMQTRPTSSSALGPYLPPWGSDAVEPPGPAALPAPNRTGGGRPRRPPQLFTPFTARGLTLKNRIVVSPMYAATHCSLISSFLFYCPIYHNKSIF